MVFKCCAPNCRGNYTSDEKVSTFKFPKNKDLRKKWINALKRKDFAPTTYTRVCEKHFKSSDIIRETSYFDDRTAKLLTAPLKYPRLKEGAIPSILPQRPKCLSQPSTSTSRESRKDRNLRLKEEQFQQATEENVKLQKAYSEGKSFNNFEEFLVCLEKNTQFLNPNNDWVIVKQGQFVEFHIIKRDPIPKIMITVMINNLCDVRVFTDSTTELQKLQNFDLPFHIDSITHLDEILRLASQTPSNSSATLKFYIEAIQALFYNVIDLVPVEHKKRIEFLLEQMKVIVVVLSCRK